MHEPLSRSGAVSVAAAHYDAVVLGAGITGLVATSVLAAQGLGRVLVVDSYDHIGGNHIDRQLPPYTFDVGSFIFQDDSPLLAHFPEILDRYEPILPRWGRLNPQGKVTIYPISIRDDVLAAGPLGLARMAMSVAHARLIAGRPRNARDFARFWIGDALLRRSGLDTYMRRFYGLEPEQIDLKLAEKRMLWISEQASLTSLLRRLLPRRATAPTNRQLARPREGFAYLYAPIREKLEKGGATFRLGSAAERVERSGDTFFLTVNGKVMSADRVISTIPVDMTSRLCGLPETGGLAASKLLSLFFSFDGKRGFDQSILYNFSDFGAWKRLTMYSDFYGQAAGRDYFTVEVIGEDLAHDPHRAERDFADHARANGLFHGDLKLEGSHLLDEAYPLYRIGSWERAEAAIRALRTFGVESFGRQGGFDYQPTARVSTQVAEAALRPAAGR
ncbi:NAD(P)-binding protein [Phreatobacter sp.]|uniref:NAD(P)-binding protein n=1 Tax=Phreatobacter sp. TaxID=1966341 RepID=UPI003F6F2569